MKRLTLTVKETAEFLGVSTNNIRIGLQRGCYSFGTAVGKPSVAIPNRINYKYHIVKSKVEDYMGVSYEDFLKIKEETKGVEIDKS